MNEELKIIISAEISKLKQGIENAKNSVKSFSDKVAQAKKEVDDKFKNMGASIANGAKGIATGIAAVTTALVGASVSTKEYAQQQAQLTTAFEQAGVSAYDAYQTYEGLYRVLGDSGQATEAAQHLAKLTNEEEALAEWTNICQGVYATFGASLPIEGLTEAANETAKVGTVTGSLADALNWAGISEDAFNEKLEKCNTEAEREALIRSTLTGLYDEAAKGYETNNEAILKQNEAQANLMYWLSMVGQTMQPVITAFMEFGGYLLESLDPILYELGETVVPVLIAALEKVAYIIEEAAYFIYDYREALIPIAGIIAGIVASIGLYNAVAAVKAAMDAAQVTTLAGLAGAYLAQAAAMVVAIAPYVLIVAAIAAVIAIIVLCVKHWDKISATVKKVAADIAKWVSDMSSKAVAKFNELKDKATQKIESLKQSATEKFQSLKQSATEKIQSAKTAVTEAFSNMVSSGKEKLSNMVSAVKEKFDSIKSSIKEKIDGAKNLVKSGLDAIKNFFSSASWELPKIKLPHFSISGNFSLNPPSIPKFSVSWYKLGGVFDNPVLFPYGNGSVGGLGENGAEMVAPLENNLGWLDKLASMLDERMNSRQPNVLEVDGEVFARTAIKTINRQTRQTGKLALNLV